MEKLLRYPGAVRRDPRVEAWFSERPDLMRLMTRAWFERMRKCGKDVREMLHDGCPVACVGDAPFGISLIGPAGSDMALTRLGRAIIEAEGKA